MCHSLLSCCQDETSRSKALDLKVISQEGTAIFIEGFPVDANFNIVTCEEERVPFSFEGNPGDHVCIVDISLEEGLFRGRLL